MVKLIKAEFEDCAIIHDMQTSAFGALLEKYGDIETNPGAEGLERITARMKQKYTDYYLIQSECKNLGAMRVARLSEKICRISPMFILPEFQGKGLAQEALTAIELLYPEAELWTLETIKQEAKLCYLYEKMGYQRTGREEDIQDNMTIIFYEKRIIKGGKV